MQHALLGLGIALILAIAAALAAPAYVDWNDWRSTFERQASAIAGAPVRIRGRIEATILPTPAFVLRAVEIGDPDKGTGMRAGEARGILSLGALMRGSVEADEFVLVRPAMRLAIEPGGWPTMPAMGAAAAATDLVTFARIAIEGGSLVVEDRASGERQVFDQISAHGEMRARQGPKQFNATLRHDGRRWSVRANSGAFGADNSGRVRLTLERAGDSTAFDAEGMLTLSGVAPRFEGKISMARRGAPGLAWQITANARANEQAVSLDTFELTLGADATPIEVAGQVQFAPRRDGAIEGALSARRIDLDAATGGEGPKGLPAAFASVREVMALLNGLPFRGRIGLSVENLIAGGGTLRELKADLALRDNALALEKFEARLPGRGTIKAAGPAAGNSVFAGDLTVEAEDASAFARWAFGGTLALSLEGTDSTRLTGKANWTDGRITIQQLDLSLGGAKLGGRFTLTPGEGVRRTKIEADLVGSGLDLDVFGPLVESLRTDSAAVDLVLGFSGNALRLLDRPASRIDAAIARSDEGITIERLAIADFDGLSVRAKGRIAAPIERPTGSIEYEIEAVRPDGIALLANKLAGEDAALLVRRILSAGGPLKLSGTASGAGSAAGVEVNASGRLSDMEASFAASYDILAENLSEAHIVVDSRDSGKLISLFGFTPGPPSPGDGTLELDFSKPSGGAMLMAARLAVPGANLSADGELRRGAEGRIEPRIDLRLEASDLRPLLAVVARAGGDRAVAADGSARLSRNAEAFAFENIALNVNGARVRGVLTASGVEKPAIGGKLAIERMGLADLLGLVLGSAENDGGLWPAARLNPAPLTGATGTIEFEVAALGLVDRLAATGSKFRLKLGAADAAFEDFSADLAGGKLEGHARFVRGEALGFDSSGKLNSFEVARMLSPGTWKAAARGRGSLTLTLAGSGATPATLAGSLAGQGTLALESLEIDRLDPGAVASVFSAAEANEPPDEIAVIAALAPAFAKGPLKLANIEAPVVVAAGVARTGRVRANAGSMQISAAANFDIGRLSVDGTVEIEAPAPQGLTARPGATVRWRGPVAAPERGIEAAALATAITLRAMERETKRIEERDRALPPRRSEQPGGRGEPSPVAAATPEPAATPDVPIGTSPSAAPAAKQAPAPQTRPRAGNPWAGTAPSTNIRPTPQIFPPPQ
ncbi:MAG: AsmA-like C-terminal region-containing protein [Xanthobacteraceae bacterium]